MLSVHVMHSIDSSELCIERRIVASRVNYWANGTDRMIYLEEYIVFKESTFSKYNFRCIMLNDKKYILFLYMIFFYITLFIICLHIFIHTHTHIYIYIYIYLFHFNKYSIYKSTKYDIHNVICS